ncbi:MAG: peptide deformylase [Alphaproteobacteria bacterium]
MTIRPIVIAPDRRLKTRCAPVERVDDDVRRLMDDMLETMYDAPGIGLAAPQIGVLRRVIVMDLGEEGARRPLMLADPQILRASTEEAVGNEGCLSLPEIYVDVPRPIEVTVRYLDREGQERELEADGLLARCIQHEIDHLDGVLHVDYLSTLRRKMILRRLEKQRRVDAVAD